MQTLIENTRELQVAMQPSEGSEYTNLQSFGLIEVVSIATTIPAIPVTPAANLEMHFVSFTLGGDNTIIIWDITDPNAPLQLATLSGHSDSIYKVAFSPDGEYVISGSGDNTARVWEAATGREVARMNS